MGIRRWKEINTTFITFPDDTRALVDQLNCINSSNLDWKTIVHISIDKGTVGPAEYRLANTVRIGNKRKKNEETSNPWKHHIQMCSLPRISYIPGKTSGKGFQTISSGVTIKVCISVFFSSPIVMLLFLSFFFKKRNAKRNSVSKGYELGELKEITKNKHKFKSIWTKYDKKQRIHFLFKLVYGRLHSIMA